MMSWYISILFFLLATASCGRTHLLKEISRLDHYPSASGLEYHNGQFYIIGDDATYLLVLDSNFILKDSVQLYPASAKRLPKETKPDLEAITMLGWKESPKLLVTGSGSLSPFRNTCWLINPIGNKTENFRLDTFYQRLKYNGLEELNIEGACSIPGYIVLSNRGHIGYPRNYLVFTSQHFWRNQENAALSLVKVGGELDTTKFSGVSGLAYAPRSDRLLMAVSTEDTRSVYEDGAIGKSYLWIVKNISAKRRWKSVNPDQVIDLEAIDRRFRGQKIESVCVVKETRHFLQLVLAADNDDGSSTLFRIMVEKN